MSSVFLLGSGSITRELGTDDVVKVAIRFRAAAQRRFGRVIVNFDVFVKLGKRLGLELFSALRELSAIECLQPVVIWWHWRTFGCCSSDSRRRWVVGWGAAMLRLLTASGTKAYQESSYMIAHSCGHRTSVASSVVVGSDCGNRRGVFGTRGAVHDAQLELLSFHAVVFAMHNVPPDTQVGHCSTVIALELGGVPWRAVVGPWPARAAVVCSMS